MTLVKDIIEQKLTTAFSPEAIKVLDDSHHHAGHAGASPDGQTHFTVRMTASSLKGLSRVKQQQAIYKELAAEMAGPIHALVLKIKTED